MSGEFRNDQPNGMGKKIKGRLFLLLKLGVTVGLICFLFSRIDLAVFFRSFLDLHLGWLFLAYAAMWATHMTHNFLWQKLFREQGIFITYRCLFSCYLAGYFVSHFLPRFIVGDMARAFYASRLGIDKARSLAVTLFCRMINITMLLVIFIICVLVNAPLREKLQLSTVLVVSAAIVLLALITLTFLTLSSKRFRQFLGELKGPLLRGIETLRHFRNRWHMLGIFCLISLAQQSTVLLRYYLLSLAMGMTLNFSSVATVTVLVLALQTIPITINGIGLRETGFVYLLGFLGVAAEKALSFTLLNYGLMLLNACIGGIFFVRGVKKRNVSTDLPAPQYGLDREVVSV